MADSLTEKYTITFRKCFILVRVTADLEPGTLSVKQKYSVGVTIFKPRFTSRRQFCIDNPQILLGGVKKPEYAEETHVDMGTDTNPSSGLNRINRTEFNRLLKCNTNKN